MDRAAGNVDPYPVLTATARSLGWIVGLTLVGAALWAWRTRVARPNPAG